MNGYYVGPCINKAHANFIKSEKPQQCTYEQQLLTNNVYDCFIGIILFHLEETNVGEKCRFSYR
jgi:hypothetical protein